MRSSIALARLADSCQPIIAALPLIECASRRIASTSPGPPSPDSSASRFLSILSRQSPASWRTSS